MKKIFARIVGSICILAVLLTLFLSAWVTIKDVSRKDLKQYRNQLITDLETVEQRLILRISVPHSDIKEDLKDNDLPATKTAIKNRVEEVKAIIEELLDTDISLKEVFVLTSKAPRYIEDTGNMLDISACADMVFKATELAAQDEVETIVEEADSLKGAFVAATIFFIVLIVLGCASAVTHSLNKVRFLKYIFLSLVLLLVVGVSIGVPVVNDLIQNEIYLLSGFEDVSLAVTAMPYICIALALIPVILDIIFERKKTNTMSVKTQTEGLQPSETEVAAEENAVTEETEAPTKEQPPEDSEQKVKKGLVCISKKVLIPVVAVLVAVAIALPIISVVLSNTYKTPVKVMEKLENKRKISDLTTEYAKLTNGVGEKEFRKIFGIMKKSEQYEDLMDVVYESFEESIESNEDEYGKNYKISYKIEDKDELEKSDLKKIKQQFKNAAENLSEMIEEAEDFDSTDWEDMAEELGITKAQAKQLVKEIENLCEVFKKVEVTKGYELAVTSTITGSELDEPEEDEATLYVYKVNGRWISATAVQPILFMFGDLL